MRIFILMLTLTSSVFADDATLLWDHPGVGILGYRVYLDDTKISEVTERKAVVTLPSQGGMFSVSAYSAFAESAKSNPVGVPSAPTSITITLEVLP